MRALMVLLLGLLISAMVPSAAAGQELPDALSLKVHFAQVEGLRTAYAVVGDDRAKGAPLLLLNGTGSPMSQWDPALLAYLSSDRQVVVYDYPGLGQSQRLSGRLTFDRLAQHAAELVEVLGWDSVDVLGWSMGGFVAQRLAFTHPETVRSLILAGTNPGGSQTVLGPKWVQEADSDPKGSNSAYVRTNYPKGHRSAGWAFIHRVNEAFDQGRWPEDRIPAAVYRQMVAAEDPWLRSNLNFDQLPSIVAPTLVITGSLDRVTPFENSVLLADSIPDATLVLVDQAGHSFLFQDPALAASLFLDFLG